MRSLLFALGKSGGIGAVSIKAPLDGHLWHVIEGLAFLVMSLGGIWVSEVVQNRRRAAEVELDRMERSSLHGYVSGAAVGNRASSHSVWLTREGARSRSDLLPLVGLGSIAAASVHFVVMPHHFEEGTIYGCFFAVTATLQVIFGLLTLSRPSRPLVAIGLVGNVAVITLWLITRTVGIPLGPAAGTTDAVGGLDILATFFEAMIVCGSAALLWRWRDPMRAALRPSTWVWQIWILIVAAPLAIAITTVVQPPS